MVLQVKKINYSINKIKILDEVSFIVPDNKICAFIGKNGAGKTTVIKSILNLLKTYTGNIMINSISSMDSESRATLSYCPEKEELPNMIIYDFLLEQACYSGWTKKEGIDQIQNLCKTFDFPVTKLKLKINNLSSGLKKVIMLMETFLSKSKFFILDEPTANLDFETRMLFYKFVLKKNKLGATFLISTHDLFEIKHYANYYIKINNGKIILSSKSPPRYLKSVIK